MQISLEKNMEGIDRDQWNALVHNNSTNTIYQTYEWNLASFQVYGRADNCFILCVKDKEELVAIVPLMFAGPAGNRTLQFVGGHRSDYCDILCSKRQDEILELVWQYIFSKRKEWGLIRLNNVPLETPLARYIKANKDLQCLSHRSSQNEAVLLRFKEDEAYTHQVLHKKKTLTYRDYFKTKGSYQVLHLNRHEDIEPYLEDFFAQHIKRWQDSHYPSLFLDSQNKKFYRHIVQTLPQGWITFTVLKWNDQVLGYHLGFSYGKRFIWYKPTFNPAFASRSPGQVLLQETMEYAYTQGFNEFDLGVGKEAYKYRFGNTISYNNSFKVYPSRAKYLCYYIPLAIRWRLQKLGSKLNLEKLLSNTA
jgi:CelD/BcsL family acetyltransferase involved in cellulose biosynthesis